jgi:predicted nucleic acid-binding protein
VSALVVLDATFLIALERGDAGAARAYASFVDAGKAIRIPAAVWVEYLSPMDAATRRKARATLEEATLFEPFHREVADEAVDLQHELLRSGRRIGWHDLQVAATARLHREPLISNDATLADLPGVETQRH